MPRPPDLDRLHVEKERLSVTSEKVRDALGADAFDGAFSEGAALDLAAAFALAEAMAPPLYTMREARSPQ